jgi:hypothetical protein
MVKMLKCPPNGHFSKIIKHSVCFRHRRCNTSLVINTDDTGWRVEGSTAHLMVFVGVQSTDSLAAVIARDPDWAALPGVNTS